MKTLSPDYIKVEKKIKGEIGRLISDYNLIEHGDKILVCLSGGKDSLALLYFLKYFQSVAPIDFTLLPFHLEQGQPGFLIENVETQLKMFNLQYIIENQDTYSIVKDKLLPDQTPCSLCSRLRRGIIYSIAEKK